MIKSANQYLNEKLGSIVDCRNLVDLSILIEKRIRTFFKDVFKENEQVSRTMSLNHLQQVIDTDVTPINIKEAEDVKPHLIAQMKAEYCQVLQKYLEAINGAENLGPYRAQAVFDIFQTSIIDQVQTLSGDIEKVQQSGIDKAQALLSEYQRQERSLQDLVNF